MATGTDDFAPAVFLEYDRDVEAFPPPPPSNPPPQLVAGRLASNSTPTSARSNPPVVIGRIKSAAPAPAPAPTPTPTPTPTRARRSRTALAEDEYPIFALNEQVRAVYKARQGGVKKYKGTISGVLEDNMYNITYEDGDIEQGVHARYVLRVGSKLHDNTTPPDMR